MKNGLEEIICPPPVPGLAFDLLSHLVAEFDAAEVKWPKVKGSGVLEHLMDEQGMTAADLSRVLGSSRNLGGMILRGERRLTLDHVTRLARHFHVSPALFLGK